MESIRPARGRGQARARPGVDRGDGAGVAVDLDARFSPQFIHGDTLYLFTTMNAPNGKLYAVDLTRPERDNWRAVLPERDDAVLRTVDEARGMFVATYFKDVVTRLERYRMDGALIGGASLDADEFVKIVRFRDQ
jgi:prolyl oligopeptidase